MSLPLAPEEPLSQVSFVQDYFQLVFGEEVLTVNGAATVVTRGQTLLHGAPGFFDALAHLIGQRATFEPGPDPAELLLRFSSNAKVHVRKADGKDVAPEAFVYHGCGGIVVGRR